MRGLIHTILVLSMITICCPSCAKQDLPREPARPAAPLNTIPAGLSSLEVVKQIGFPTNGGSLGKYCGAKVDVWSYDNGMSLLVFENGKLVQIIGKAGERPLIRLQK